MNVYRAIAELRTNLSNARASGLSIGFVPTMGALHEGHLSLVRLARASTDVVVLSIFVNPLQFGPHEDLDRYPRMEERDLEAARQAGVDVAFLPSVEEIYPAGAETRVAVGPLAEVAEGVSRPGHFEGVATVVVKLLNIVQPTTAYFGQKDAQQVAVVKRVVSDLSIPVEVVVGETVRERDGLALSSRNAYLDAAQRKAAVALWQALRAGSDALAETDDPRAAEKVMADVITDAGLVLDYALVVDATTFGPPESDRGRLLVVAAKAGSTRLIDNLPLPVGAPGRDAGG